jgi:SNF2 family DNA or RNA helicase
METDFIKIPLYDHQKESINNMEQLEKNMIIPIDTETSIETKLGILADVPGYGKTLSVLGLIGKTKFDTEENFYIQEKKEITSLVSKVKLKKMEQLSITLILVNVSLLSQWIFELSRTTLRYLAIYTRNDIEGIDLSKYDLILVSHNIYNLFCQVYRNKCWKRFMIDEPASLKIVSMEEITAKFYWLITATPYELYPRKRIGFINEMIPEYEWMKYIMIKNEDQFVRTSYDMPITNHIYYKITCDISKIFESIVNHNIMEMLEAGNISGVLTSFGNISDSVIDSFIIRKKKRLSELMIDEENVEKIQLIQNHLQLLEDRLRRYACEYLCIMCNQSQKQLYLLSCCNVLYCGCTINCKLCKSIDCKKILLDINDIVPMNQYLSNVSKIEQTMKIISNGINKKILIFSNFNESFIILKKFLEESQIHYLELKGTKEKRDNTIDLYKSGNVNILLLNTIHSGAGLNLPETTDIIIYHRLHDYQKTQVIGRANRIGRKLNLNVHYLE